MSWLLQRSCYEDQMRADFSMAEVQDATLTFIYDSKLIRLHIRGSEQCLPLKAPSLHQCLL